MNDFDYDVYRKKNVARSAARRKCGSKSKKCTLPSDHLTKSQLKKLNGEVVTYKMKEPIVWKEFKAMPPALQSEYITGLINEFHVTMKYVADMLGISTATFRRHLQTECTGVRFTRGKRMSLDAEQAWLRFLGDYPAPSAESVQEPDESDAIYDYETDDSDTEQEPVSEPESEERPSRVLPPPRAVRLDPPAEQSVIDSFQIKFTDRIDLDRVFNSLRVILGSDPVAGDIEVRCKFWSHEDFRF